MPRKRKPESGPATARQWVDANGIDVAEYIYGELLAEVPRQFRFIVECMAKRAVARAKEESLKQNLSAYLRTDPRYIKLGGGQ